VKDISTFSLRELTAQYLIRLAMLN